MQIFGTCSKFGDSMVREKIRILYTHFWLAIPCNMHRLLYFLSLC
jgi:hypothetical protein